MAKVKVSTKYPLKQEDYELACQSKGKDKLTWWMKDLSSNVFLKIPWVLANAEPNLEIDLDDGSYQLGCGDYNAINGEGRHCTQNVYFYIENGVLHYVKRKDELPINGGSGASSNTTQTSFDPLAKKTSVYVQAQNSPQYEEMKNVRYCCHEDYNEFHDCSYSCVVDYDGPDDAKTCDTCKFGKRVFLL